MIFLKVTYFCSYLKFFCSNGLVILDFTVAKAFVEQNPEARLWTQLEHEFIILSSFLKQPAKGKSMSKEKCSMINNFVLLSFFTSVYIKILKKETFSTYDMIADTALVK